MRVALLLTVALLALPARAQFPVPVVGPDGADWDVTEIQMTADGATYAIGQFETELTLGSDGIAWDAPNPTGFLARFSPTGVLEWVHVLEARRGSFGDEANAEAKRIAALPDGSVVLLGTLTVGLTIDLDPGAGEAVAAPPGADPIAFLVRYTPSGAYAWSGVAELKGLANITSRLGLGHDASRVFALLPPAHDASFGADVVETNAAAIVAVEASTGATAYVQETALPFGSLTFLQDLAVSGDGVYALGQVQPFSGSDSYRLSRHDAATGAETWTFESGSGRDVLSHLEPGSGGAVVAAGALSSSATGIALDPADPSQLTVSRSGDAETALARYTAAGALDWAAAVEIDIGAWGGAIAVEGGEVFGSGFGHLRAYAEADGAVLRSLPAEFGRPNLHDIAAGPDRLVSYADPESSTRTLTGIPDGLPQTLLVQFEQSDLSVVISPPVATERGAGTGPGTLGLPRPHPVVARSEVLVSAPEAGRARLVLLDVLGRTVRRLHDGPLLAGDTRVALDADGLAAGLYVLALEHAGGRTARTVVVAH